MEMLDVGFEPHQLFLNVAAFSQDGRFLQDAVLFHIAHQFRHARAHLLHVRAAYSRAHFRNFLGGLFQRFQPAPKLGFHAASFLFAHGVESGDGLIQAGQDCRFKFSIGRGGCTQRSRDP